MSDALTESEVRSALAVAEQEQRRIAGETYQSGQQSYPEKFAIVARSWLDQRQQLIAVVPLLKSLRDEAICRGENGTWCDACGADAPPEMEEAIEHKDFCPVPKADKWLEGKS